MQLYQQFGRDIDDQNQTNHGTGSDMETWRDKQKACYQQPRSKH